MTFQDLNMKFLNSMTFQDFHGLYEPCEVTKGFLDKQFEGHWTRGGGGHWTKSSCRPKSRIPHSSGKNFPDSGISISLHEAIPGFLILMLNDVKFSAFARISRDKYL